MKPLLADGAEFVIGMPVVFESSREVQTDDTMEVVLYECEGRTIFILQRKNSPIGTNLRLLYPSQQARIKAQVERLYKMRAEITLEIERLQMGEDPKTMYYLNK